MQFTKTDAGVIADLTEDELNLVERVAATRLSAKVAGVKSKKWTPGMDELETHRMGVKSELVVAEYLGCPKDSLYLVYHRGGDRGLPDLMAPDCSAISVKCRSRFDGDFATEYQKPDQFSDDIGVLCVDKGKRCFIVGWFHRETFIEHAEIADYGYGPRCILRQAFMSHPDRLRELVHE